MSRLTQMIRNVVGPGKAFQGRGQKWLQVGHMPVPKCERMRVVDSMKRNFETFHAVNDDHDHYTFNVTSITGIHLGVCSITIEHMPVTTNMIIDYFEGVKSTGVYSHVNMS